jgi:Endonuclease/Exonuclease/phosphatase family
VKHIFFTIICVFILKINGLAQDQYKMIAVGFYNLENLFDTENDTTINDEDFLPDGKMGWTPERYAEKLTNMAYAVSQIGLDHTKSGLSVFGVAEIENRKVLEDLVVQPALANRNYKIVHYNSPDRRGIDVGLIYNPAHFTPIDSKPIPLLVYENEIREYTRDILFVKGVLDGDTICFMVNHWPSRRGGEEASAYKRNKGAQICRQVIDSLYGLNPHSKVIVMGDLNDDPTSISIKNYLKAKDKISDLKSGDVFNPMVDYYRRGIGSNAYRDSWSLFDQLMFSWGLMEKEGRGYHYQKAFVFNEKFLIQASGQYKGYPFRTFSFDTYQGGYSDHFPSYALLVRKV